MLQHLIEHITFLQLTKTRETFMKLRNLLRTQLKLRNERTENTECEQQHFNILRRLWVLAEGYKQTIFI